jgi:hypothetical protein
MFAPAFADPVVGMHAATALQRSRNAEHGRGQPIEVAQAGSRRVMTAEQVIHHLTGELLSARESL